MFKKKQAEQLLERIDLMNVSAAETRTYGSSKADPSKAVWVRDVMTSKVISLNPTNDFADAVALMSGNQLHHCIIVDKDGRLVGVLSDRDVLRGLARDEKWQDKKLDEVMVHNPISVTSDAKLVEAIAKMIAHDIHCLPVVKANRVVTGILTSTNALQSFQTILESLPKNLCL